MGIKLFNTSEDLGQVTGEEIRTVSSLLLLDREEMIKEGCSAGRKNSESESPPSRLEDHGRSRPTARRKVTRKTPS